MQSSGEQVRKVRPILNRKKFDISDCGADSDSSRRRVTVSTRNNHAAQDSGAVRRYVKRCLLKEWWPLK